MNKSLEYYTFLISVQDMFEEHKKDEALVKLLTKEMANQSDQTCDNTSLPILDKNRIFYNFLVNTIVRRMFSSSSHSDSSCTSVSSLPDKSSKLDIADSAPEQKTSDTSSIKSESKSVVNYNQEHLLKELTAARRNIKSATESIELLKETCLESTVNSTDEGETSEDSLSSGDVRLVCCK